MISLVPKLLVMVDRQQLALDYGMDPDDPALVERFAEMVMGDVAGLSTWEGNGGDYPLVALDAGIVADPEQPWRVRRVKNPAKFMALTLLVRVTIDSARTWDWAGLGPEQVVPHWLAAQLAQVPVIRVNRGTVLPLM